MRKEKCLKEVTQNRSETWPIFVTPSVTYWWNGCRRSRRRRTKDTLVTNLRLFKADTVVLKVSAVHWVNSWLPQWRNLWRQSSRKSRPMCAFYTFSPALGFQRRLLAWDYFPGVISAPQVFNQDPRYKKRRSKASGFQVKSDSSIWEDFKSGCEGNSFCYILTLYSGWLGIARVLRGESSRWILKIGMSWMEAAKNIP